MPPHKSTSARPPAFSESLALDAAVIEHRNGVFENVRSQNGIEIFERPWPWRQVEYGLHNYPTLWSCCICAAFL
jgi:hypothetical protein